MGRYFKLLITIFLLTALYGGYYWGIPAIIDLPNRADLLEEIILKESGYKVEITNPDLKMGLIPSVWVKADSFSLVNDDNSEALSIKKPLVNVRILPLVLKNIDIKHFSANGIYANLVFTKNSELKIGQYPLNQKFESPFKLKHLSAVLDEYKINLDDQLQSKKIFLDGDYISIGNFNEKHIDLSTAANLTAGSKKSYLKADIDLQLPINNVSNDQLELNGHLINLDLSDFSVYAKSISKNKIESLSGIINFTANTVKNSNGKKQIKTNLYVNNLGIYNKDKASSIYSKGKFEVNTDINTLKNGIDINEMKITADGINSFVSGEITKLNNKIPNLDLKISVNNSKAENIIPLLPGEPDLDPDINFLVLKKTGFWGNVNCNLELKGKADFPEVYGKVLVSDAYMVKPIKNADKAVIKLDFKGDVMNLDVKVPTSPMETVYVKGPIKLDKDRTADLYITSTKNVDLKTAQIVLNPLHEILRFDIGPVPIMDIQGKGGINFHVVGTKKNPHGWGQFWFKDATVSFLDIKNMVLKNGSGTLDFDDQNTFFQTKKAYLNGEPISVSGTCSLLGNLNFNVKAPNQELGNLLKIVKTSPMLIDIQKLTNNIENGSGKTNFILNLTGQVKDVNDVVFNKNIFAKGKIELLSNTIRIKDVPVSVSKLSGVINFNNLNADFDLKSALSNSLIFINGKIKDNLCDAIVNAKNFNIGNGLKAINSNGKVIYPNSLNSLNTSFTAKYKGKLDEIEYNNISIKGILHNNQKSKNNLLISHNSNYELSKSNFKLPKLKGSINNSPFDISLNVEKCFNNDRNINGYIRVDNFDLNTIKDKSIISIMPKQIKSQLDDIVFLNGKINIKSRIRNNNITAYVPLNNLSLIYRPKFLKVVVNSGDILLRNDQLSINKINAQMGHMPVFLNGKVSNIYKKPNLNIYANTKLTQEFFDQFFNNKALYPIKIKGDVILTTKAQGTLDNLHANSVLNIDSASSLYYMGASIGDIENPVKITVSNVYSPNKIKINNLQYDKIITSQNNRPYTQTQLNAAGTLTLLSNNNIGFNNFKVKTQTPTDAKIFNIIFRKPFMKQGVFTSDLVLNGTALTPKVRGKFDVTSIDIPFLDSTIRDINLDFRPDNIYIKSRGTVLTNDVYLNAVMKNNLTAPYIIENFNLKLRDLDVNKITDTLRDFEAESTRNPSVATAKNNSQIDITQLIINNGKIDADTIKVRNINADNFTTNLSLDKNSILSINDFKFDIAEGSVLGGLKYNLANDIINLDIHLDKANAQIMSEAMFDLKGQVYGLVNGDFDLTCNGRSHESCFRTLSGEGTFKIADGRMPKLGSLEYLLKAGNLLKGGFTGLSINSLIDLVTPLKTGNFDSISGDIHINNGVAHSINIYSNGNDLNMYMTGSYNLLSSIADMKIYGSLTKNITTVFGKIKNASLNTLFNTIPGVNSQNEALLMQTEISKIPDIKNATNIYRIFAVEINGDINGENYVRSFKWVK